MARLLIKSRDCGEQVIELRLGVNRLGRGQDNDFQLDHPTISSRHCDLVLSEDGILLVDRGSTNGSFVSGHRVERARLSAGQTFLLGEVEFFVANTDVTVSIPRAEDERSGRAVGLTDGEQVCPRHPQATARYQCTHCGATLCELCLHRLKRRGGKAHLLCPLCSHECATLGGPKTRKRKRAFLEFLRKTVRLPLARGQEDAD